MLLFADNSMRRARVNLHSKARTCPESRGLLVERVNSGWLVKAAAAALGISRRTASKWLRRFREEGEAGLHDRTSRPSRIPRATEATVVAQVLNLRRTRLPATEVARRLALARSTVGLILRRNGLSRWSSLFERDPLHRYEHEAPGDLLHLDTKKLGRIEGIGHRITGSLGRGHKKAGWEIAHVAIDDHSRAAYVEILPNEEKETTAAFLQRALLHFGSQGITVRKLLTDNGGAYRSKVFAQMAREECGLKHSFTRPYRPQTNGKAERFIQTALREWAYRIPYQTSEERSQALAIWLHYYNNHRPHSSLGGRPPASRVNNLFSLDN
jgi:transposase InsO family protein